MEEVLQGLRVAHGASRWNAAAGARFSYRLSLPATGRAASLDVAFRRGDLQHVWVTSGAGKEPLRLRLDAPAGALAEALAVAGALSPGAPGDLSSTLDFSLRAIRYFLSLPLMTLRGRWEFRGLTAPPGIPRPAVLEVCPQEPGVPFTLCWMARDAKTRLLSKVLYEVPPEFLSGGYYEVSFSMYEEKAGMTVARSRSHAPVESRSPGDPPRDPFFHLEVEKPRGRLSFEEEVTGVLLLSSQDVDAACPLPSEEPDPGKPTQDGLEGAAR